MDDILDYDKPPLPPPLKKKQFRLLALIIELGPFLLGVFGLVLSIPSLTIISWCILAMIYIAMSWYFFKAIRFEVGAIIYATFSGIALSTVVMGLLFAFLRWEGAYEMVTIAIASSLPLMLISIIWYFIRRKKHFELTLSLKILSRFLIGILLMLLAIAVA